MEGKEHQLPQQDNPPAFGGDDDKEKGESEQRDGRRRTLSENFKKTIGALTKSSGGTPSKANVDKSNTASTRSLTNSTNFECTERMVSHK